ncbi:hypothetical protein [Solilutibacter pythonis]|uniref:hypothetical protein n=1 Tax=Solilutibacter pythonis TaxID=2483112 RepID=UPI0011C36098|nr:hypothetical protein [Lysobacter pythonis]
MKRDDINWLLDRLDGSGFDDEYDAIKKLRALGEGLPALLLEKYRNSKKKGQRASCVYNSIRYARYSQVAVDLGIEALIDKSYPVRYRACMLLAYSLNLNSLSALRIVFDKTSHQQTKGDLLAAIDAIKNNNSNYFLDRDHSGNVILRVN